MSEKKKKVILLYSGGRDSFLSSCLLVEAGYSVDMITFGNGLSISEKNARHGAKRLIKRYGSDRIAFLGAKSIAGIWRAFLLPYYNLMPSEILKEYGELTISQFNCLTCRMAMYTWAIIKAKQDNICFIADGARKSQGFVVELPSFIKELEVFLSTFEIKLLLPVFDLDMEQKRKDLLLLRGFTPKSLEPQCLIGVPLPNNKAPDETIQKAVIKYFNTIIVPKAKEIIAENYETNLGTNSVMI